MNAFVFAAVATAVLATPGQAQDTLVVRADNPPVWGASPRLVEELRIGTLEGDPNESFGMITGVAPGANGEIWIADDQVHAIRRFGADGRYVGDVGRVGQGPGEFTRVTGLQRLSDGRIAAWDPGQRKVHVFGADGRFLASVTMPFSCAVFMYYQPTFIAGPDDGFFTLSCETTVPPAELGRLTSAAAVQRAMRNVWIQTTPGGSATDTLRNAPSDNSVGAGRNHPFGYMTAYVPRTITALSPLGYLVSASTDRYAFQRTLRDGRIVRVERSWTPVSVQGGEKEMVEALREADRRRQVAQGREADLPEPRVPDTKPPIWAFQLDQDGRIWAAVHQEGYHRPESEQERAGRMKQAELIAGAGPGARTEWWEPLVVDVLEPSGRFLGTVRFPNNRSSIAWSSGDTLWAVELGEYDEAYLVRYRIEHP